MKSMKKGAAWLLTLAFAFSLTGCGSAPASSDASSSRKIVSAAIATLKGPTGFGMLKMMQDADNGKTNNVFTTATSPDEIVSALSSGSVNMAAVPTNLAATLYQKTSGEIQIACVNTLGVLWLVTNGEEVSSVADLRGKTLYSSGKGAIPEYALNYILEQNGLKVGEDVTVEYSTEHSELAAKVLSGSAPIAVLPEPFVTQVLSKGGNVKRALNLTEEWDRSVKDGSVLSMGCLVVRREYAEANPDYMKTFLKDYAESIQFTKESPAEAAKLAEQYFSIPAGVAKQAIPNCGIEYLDGAQMKEKIKPFLQVLYDANPKSVGGALPEDDFYYDASR